MNNILITSAGRRVSLVKAFIKELKLIDPAANVYITDLNPALSAASQVAHKAFKICRIEEDGYIDSLIKICMENNIKLIIPTIDLDLIKLSENINKFRAKKIEVVISDEKMIKLCHSKLYADKIFDLINITVPKNYNKYDFKLPLFIKPINGSSSINNFIICTEDEMSVTHLRDNNLVFFEYIDKNYYDEYTCDLFFDKSSILKCVIPRKRLEIRSGEVSKGVTKKNRLADFLKINASTIKGMRGCITIQVFLNKKTDEIIGIEFNPRFGGGYPLSYLAGANFPKWIIQEYLMDQEISFYDDWQENLLMLRYDDEILVHDYKD